MKNILGNPAGLAQRSVRSANQKDTSLNKRTVRMMAAKEGGSCTGDPLPGNCSGRKTMCDINVGVKR